MSIARRVLVWGARGVRVGEAQNPGPGVSAVPVISLTEMDSDVSDTAVDSELQGPPEETVVESDDEVFGRVVAVPCSQGRSWVYGRCAMFAENEELVRPRRLRLVSSVSQSSVAPAPSEIRERAIPGSPTESLLNGLEEDLQRPAVGIHGGNIAATMADTDSGEDMDRESDVFVPVPQDLDSDNEEDDRLRMPRSFQAAFASLDAIDLKAEFRYRPCLMRSPPGFLRGAYKTAMRVALTEFHQAGQDETRRRRAWTLFLLLPRLLLFRPARGGLLPKGQLQERFNRFTHGEWLLLLTESRDNTERAMQTQRRRRRTQQDTVERRVQRAEALVHLGELSSGRQALEGAALAPATSKLVAPELHSQRTSSSISPQFLSS